MNFKDLEVKDSLVKAIAELGIINPTPIQEQAIPVLLQENRDFVGLAQTGTGKTAAYGLPLISRIHDVANQPIGLVICPTRELCLQISNDFRNFSRYEDDVEVVAVYGGADIRKQMNQIRRGVHIVVATPGRLVDLINRKAIHLDEVEIVVLDEADEMLDMGFKEDLDFILDATSGKRNTWLFSATMPPEVEKIARNYMKKPHEVSIGSKNKGNENISHIYFQVKERNRYAALKRLIDYHPGIFGLVFCRTRMETQKIAESLSKDGYNTGALHGDLSQAQRDQVMGQFRNRNIQLLIATDVAARGIDVSDITHVINYNLPDEVENYTHRSGRTARAGNTGESLVLINSKEQYKIKQIERIIGQKFLEKKLPSSEKICERQLKALVDKIRNATVDQDSIAPFLPAIFEDLKDLSKEEVITRFVSAEFNRFLNYYKNIEVPEEADERDKRKDKKVKSTPDSRQRFFVSLGRKDGLNPGGLIRLLCNQTGYDSDIIGQINIMPAFSFFDADKSAANKILSKVEGKMYEGKPIHIELTDGKQPNNRNNSSSRRNKDSRSKPKKRNNY